MKQKHTLFRLLILLGCVFTLFIGCPTDPEDDAPNPNLGGGEKELLVELALANQIKYYSLSTGEEITGTAIESNAWDIAFLNSRKIYTNSGASKKGAGDGGIWHTDKTAFALVSLNDAIINDPVYGPYNVDVKRWIGGMAGASESILNVSTFVGYDNDGDGNDGTANGLTEDTAFSASYKYNKKQFYDMVSMQPLQIDPTLQVYIVKHADGIHYSKVQITEYERMAPKDTYLVTYSNF
jgi:hypothetical protein